MPERACEEGKSICRVLITGAGSYVGSAAELWLASMPDRYCVTVLDVENDAWKLFDFSAYDVVYHVAGLVHRRKKHTRAEKELYYAINTKLSAEVACKAKESGVRQFIFMSSMSVYSGCKESCITEDTVPLVASLAKDPYGYSKLKAEEELGRLQSDSFRVVILRAPMIYGPGCKGNYARLEWLAKRIWFFPKVDNRRSMLQIETLCRFVQFVIEEQKSGVFFPQDKEYVNTAELVVRLAAENNRKVRLIPGMTGLIRLTCHLPGMGTTLTKLFGDYTYARTLPGYKELYGSDELT